MDSAAIVGAVTAVTKRWAKQRKAEERAASALARRREAMTRSRDRVTVKDVAWRVMRDAYLKASSGGTLPAHARQIMYAARGYIQEETGESLSDSYFCQTLLPDYMNAFPEQTATWDVVFDARGHFEEPHTERVVPLGTLDVRNYLKRVGEREVGRFELRLPDAGRWPTYGPEHRFSAVLFIEKEGFMPLFEAVQLKERYDIAIMSTKGMSVTASRNLVDELSAWGVPLLVLHDFDKSGFSIVGTLRRDTRRYAFQNAVKVIDLGLRLKDVKVHGLQAESVFYRKGDPRPNLRENGATEEEAAFLCAGRDWSGYHGQRVELNAFSSGELVAWIEAKLKKHGIKKVVPDDETLAAAYRRAMEARFLNRHLQRVVAEARRHAGELKIPNGLSRKIRQALRNEPALSWDEAISRGVG